MKIIKRNGQEENFDISKIERAVKKANDSVQGSSRINEEDFELIVEDVYENIKDFKTVSVETIQDKVETSIAKFGYFEVSKSYILFRNQKANKKKFTPAEEKIISITNGVNEDVIQDNSNKNPVLLSTQRDYISGTMCKSIAEKILPKEIVEAHKNGEIHFHDMDYSPVQHFSNCCLVNLKDMFEKGFVLNSVFIETPKSFRTACNLASQVALHVSSSQYGGQTMSWAHIAKFVNISREKIKKEVLEELDNIFTPTLEQLNSITEKRLKREIKDGVQTFQYQILSLSGTNGQSPFISMSMNFDECENEQQEKDLALVLEEVLKQRIDGIIDRNGKEVAPLFPKLLYFLDENNYTEDAKYWHITKLARDCNNIRMAPDFISSKVQKELKGVKHSYPCMGCRSFLTTEGSYFENGKEIKCDEVFYGRHNNGVVTINLPYVALESKGDKEEFWKILDNKLELCYRALVERYKSLKGTKAKVAPILWVYGALTRKDPEDTIDDVITGWRSTYSLGYVGLWETSLYMTGKTLLEDKEFALSILDYFQKKHEEWHKRYMVEGDPNSFLNTSTYGTPEEQTTTRFANCLKAKFGKVEGVTDHDYVTNSYHINPAQPINAFKKLEHESEFLSKSTGGAVSYIEIPNMDNNLDVISQLIEWIYKTILYAEINIRRDCCAECGYYGVINLIEENGKYIWECPCCKNRDTRKMSILRRVCGYAGDMSTGASHGRLADIYARVLHL